MTPLLAAAVAAGLLAGGAAAAAAPGGLPGYEGSASCGSCHTREMESWQATPHARTVHEASDSEKQLLARSLLCGDRDAQLVLGERHSRRYLVPAEGRPGMHLLLPCRYDVGEAEWVNLHETDWKEQTFEKGCGGCHATGFSSDDFTSRELRVGCEACHGPGARHGEHDGPGGMIVFASIKPLREAGICGACHLQGGRSRATGLNYPHNLVAGDDLFADFVFDWSVLDARSGETDNPIDVHQKILIRDLVKGGAGADDLRCTSCHAIHGNGHEKHASLARREYCYLCHEKEGFSLKEYNQSCNVCEF